jgi:DNA-binding protein HU-beta
VDHIAINDLVSKLADRTGLTPDQVRAFLQAQAELAYQHAREGFPVPGVGVLRVTDTPARTARAVINGVEQQASIPAKKLLRFRVAKGAKDTVFGPPAAPPDAFSMPLQWDENPLRD